MSRTVDLTGMRFERLIAIERTRKNGRVAWICKCDCGNETKPYTTELLRGRAKSCGCYQKSIASETFKKHGKHGTRLYRIWSNMIQRCSNPNNDSYSLYGAQGITVCDGWRDFSNFEKWAMANGYADNLSVDRIDNEKGYYPGNCRWATPQEQTDNRRCTHYVTFNGKRQTLKQWAAETGIPYKNLLWRSQKGWSAERALTTNKEE